MCVKQVGACEWKAEKQLIKGFTGLISVLSVQNRAAWVFYSPVKQNKWCLYAVFNSSCIYVCVFLDKLAAAACSSNLRPLRAASVVRPGRTTSAPEVRTPFATSSPPSPSYGGYRFSCAEAMFPRASGRENRGLLEENKQ